MKKYVFNSYLEYDAVFCAFNIQFTLIYADANRLMQVVHMLRETKCDQVFHYTEMT
jgi:hypothetical protein